MEGFHHEQTSSAAGPGPEVETCELNAFGLQVRLATVWAEQQPDRDFASHNDIMKAWLGEMSEKFRTYLNQHVHEVVQTDNDSLLELLKRIEEKEMVH